MRDQICSLVEHQPRPNHSSRSQELSLSGYPVGLGPDLTLHNKKSGSGIRPLRKLVQDPTTKNNMDTVAFRGIRNQKIGKVKKFQVWVVCGFFKIRAKNRWGGRVDSTGHPPARSSHIFVKKFSVLRVLGLKKSSKFEN